MRARGVASYAAYQALLDSDPAEYPLLMSALTINLSYFFRDGEVFLAIRDNILAPLAQQRDRAGQRRLDIWSAGCAGGEEAYSLAILLWELLAPRLGRWSVQIIASDIDTEVLTRARQGRFTDFSFRGVSEQFLSPFFTREEQHYRIHDELKRLVTFCHHDLLHHGPPPWGPFDLILCRNVLIYFTRQRQAQVLDMLCRTLRPGGRLVLGKTELPTTMNSQRLCVEDARLHIYIRPKETDP